MQMLVSGLQEEHGSGLTEEEQPIDKSEDAGRLSSSLNAHWRQDLFSAADSVTDAMSSLVNEYNDGNDFRTC